MIKKEEEVIDLESSYSRISPLISILPESRIIPPTYVCKKCGGKLEKLPQKFYMCNGKTIRRYHNNDKHTYEDIQVEGCGWTDFSDISEGPSFRASYQWSNTRYYPIHHLIESLKRLQGIEQTEIPPILLDAIRSELDRKYLTVDDYNIDIILDAMRTITRFYNIDCRAYYENVRKIRNILCGNIIFMFEPDQVDIIKRRFQEYVTSFKMIPPEITNKRKSLPEYPYIIYIICLLENFHNILPHLQLVQGNEVLTQYNAITKWICEHLGWKVVQVSQSSIFR